MTKSDLIKKVAHYSFEITLAQAEQLVSIILDEITHAVVSGQGVELRNFGTFKRRYRAGRTGRNPKTGAPVAVLAKNVMFFKAGKNLKDRLKDKTGENYGTDEG